MKRFLQVILTSAMFLSGCASAQSMTATDAAIPTVTPEPARSINIPLTPTIKLASMALESASPTPELVSTAEPYPPGVTEAEYTHLAVLQSFRRTFMEVAGQKENSHDSLSSHSVAISPNGKYVASGLCVNAGTGGCNVKEFNSKPFLVIVDASTANVVANIPVKDVTVSSLAFTPDSSHLIYAVRPLEIAIWNIAEGKKERVFLKEKGASSNPFIYINSDGTQLYLSIDKELQIYDFVSGKIIKKIPNLYGFPRVSADGTRLLMPVADNRRAVAIYDTQSWNLIKKLEPPENQSIFLSPDGKRIIYLPTKPENTFEIMDVESGKKIGSDQTVFRYLWSAQYSPDGKYILTSGTENESDFGGITLWDAESLQKVGTLMSDNTYSRFMFTPDGRYFVGTDFYSTDVWGEISPDLSKARKTVVEFYNLLSQGEYESAARMVQFSGFERDSWKIRQSNADDPAGMLKEACETGVLICLPVREILPGGGMNVFNEQAVYLHFRDPDGGVHPDADGIKDLYVFLAKDAAGNPIISLLPQNTY